MRRKIPAAREPYVPLRCLATAVSRLAGIAGSPSGTGPSAPGKSFQPVIQASARRPNRLERMPAATSSVTSAMRRHEVNFPPNTVTTPGAP